VDANSLEAAAEMTAQRNVVACEIVLTSQGRWGFPLAEIVLLTRREL
jgi:hypothetical protein